MLYRGAQFSFHDSFHHTHTYNRPQNSIPQYKIIVTFSCPLPLFYHAVLPLPQHLSQSLLYSLHETATFIFVAAHFELSKRTNIRVRTPSSLCWGKRRIRKPHNIQSNDHDSNIKSMETVELASPTRNPITVVIVKII